MMWFGWKAGGRLDKTGKETLGKKREQKKSAAKFWEEKIQIGFEVRA
jgi:hypothetical protein